MRTPTATVAETRKARDRLNKKLESFIQKECEAFTRKTGMLIGSVRVIPVDTFTSDFDYSSIGVWVEPKL